MNNIVEFSSISRFRAYRKVKAASFINSGSEGSCFLGNDGFVYKDFTEGYSSEEYDPKQVITTATMVNESFAFPHMLFVVDGKIVRLTCDFIEQDYFNVMNLSDEAIAAINYEDLIAAYLKMLDDVDDLSRQEIKLFDLAFNLLFDGKRLIGIDTCGYRRVEEDVRDFNRKCFDDAVKAPIRLYDSRYVHAVDDSMEVIPYLMAIKERYQSPGKIYQKK